MCLMDTKLFKVDIWKIFQGDGKCGIAYISIVVKMTLEKVIKPSDTVILSSILEPLEIQTESEVTLK